MSPGKLGTRSEFHAVTRPNVPSENGNETRTVADLDAAESYPMCIRLFDAPTLSSENRA